MRYFLTLAERKVFIDESVYVDCQYNEELNPDDYRAELSSLSNYDLIQVCCNP